MSRRILFAQHQALAKTSALFLTLIVLVVSLLASHSVLSSGNDSSNSQMRSCDTALMSALQLSNANLCLQDVQLSIAESNQSEFVVPVMVMGTGSVTTLEIMYSLTSQSVGWPTATHRNVTSSQVPVAISVPTGQIAQSVKFSNASLVFENKSVMIYDYTITTLAGSTGYYAILPPYYYGMLPALAIGADPNRLNASALSMWGYSGSFLSSEVTIPSSVVGTGSMTVVNSTVPMISYCLDAACTIISHSGI